MSHCIFFSFFFFHLFEPSLSPNDIHFVITCGTNCLVITQPVVPKLASLHSVMTKLASLQPVMTKLASLQLSTFLHAPIITKATLCVSLFLHLLIPSVPSMFVDPVTPPSCLPHQSGDRLPPDGSLFTPVRSNCFKTPYYKY